MNVLWIEDKPQQDQNEQKLFRDTGLFDDGTNNLKIPSTFEEALAEIEKATTEYDCVVFDINLEDFPETDQVKKIANQFRKNGNEFLREGGFYLYQRLVRQGFKYDRIVFLTGHASPAYRIETLRNSLEKTENPEYIDGILRKIFNQLNDQYAKELDEILQKTDLINNKESVIDYLDEVIQEMKKSITNPDIYDRFCELFEKSLVELAPSIIKTDRLTFNDWLREKLTKAGMDFPYITLRRGIITACRELKSKLEAESEEWILFNRTTETKLEKEYVQDYLSKLEIFFPLNPPDNVKPLYYQFIKEFSADWEMSKCYFIENYTTSSDEKFKNNYQRQMKLLRNWSSHHQITDDLDAKDIAYFFMIGMRAWFNIEFNQILDYEKKLASIFEPTKEPSNEKINQSICQSYYELKKLLENNKITSDGNNFFQLLDSIGKSLMRKSDPDLKNNIAQKSKGYFYQSLWHGIFPASLYVKNPEKTKNPGKNSVVMLVNFNKINLTKDSFPYFLGNLIFEEAFG